MKKFINNLQTLDYINTMSILDENTSNIKMTKNSKFYRQTKYINIQHYFIKKLMEQNKIFINNININNILADNFIKPLKKPKFENY